MYLIVQTRPNIAFVVQWLSRAMATPTTAHLNAAKNLPRYLNGSLDLAICYGTIKGSEGGLQPIGFCDSDFTRDLPTSRSTYGYLFRLAGRSVSWKSKRASTIALSTVEAETDALTKAIREVQWLIGLLLEVGKPVTLPFQLYEDNQGTISTSKDLTLHNCTKHTLLKFHYVREVIRAGTVKVNYLETSLMPADGLTKLSGSGASDKPRPRPAYEVALH